MANVTVTINTEDDQVVPAPIESVAVRIYDALEVFITEVTTALVTGSVDVILPGDGPGIAYIVRLFKAGVSFAPNNEFNILVTDPPAPSNIFTFTGHVGELAQPVTLVVQDNALPTPNPVEGTKVRLYDSADLFLTEYLTDAAGEVNEVLVGAPDPGQKYIARLFPPSGYTVEGGPTHEFYVLDPLVPPDTNVFDFVAAQEAAPVTGDPSLCRLSGCFINAGIIPLRELELIFRPREGYPGAIPSGFPFSSEPTLVDGKIIADEYRVKTDSLGCVDIVLPRRAVFDVFISGLSEPYTNPLASVWIPDVAGIAIGDVLFPYVKSVTYGATAINLAAGASQVVSLTVGMSNLQENVSGKDVLMALLTFTLDEAVAIFSINDDGDLLITGVAAGSTNLEVSRTVGTVAPRSPALPAILPLASEPLITVT